MFLSKYQFIRNFYDPIIRNHQCDSQVDVGTEKGETVGGRGDGDSSGRDEMDSRDRPGTSGEKDGSVVLHTSLVLRGPRRELVSA